MSRSKRKTPITGITTAESEKADKRIYNRRFRHAVKQTLEKDSSKDLPVLRELSDPWSMDKDGKSRFDPRKHPRLMRK